MTDIAEVKGTGLKEIVFENPYISSPTGPILRRAGLYYAATSSGTGGAGLWSQGLTLIGTNASIDSTTEGRYQQQSTGAVADANAGIRQTTKIYRREWGNYMICRIIPSSTSDIRCFVGWTSDTAELAGEGPLNNFSGVGVGKRAADTNWFTIRNDGDATEDRVDTTIAFAASAVTIEMWLDSTSFRCSIGGVSQTPQTTELPGLTTMLGPHIEIETGSGGADKNIGILPIFSRVGL